MTRSSVKRLLGGLCLALLLAGCLGPTRGSVEEKRAAIDGMRDQTLRDLYAQSLSAEESIRRAAGYAVFSNINAQALLLGGGGGYGVATDSDTGRKVYMKMAQVGVGLGVGIQDIRVVFVFHTS